MVDKSSVSVFISHSITEVICTFYILAVESVILQSSSASMGVRAYTARPQAFTAPYRIVVTTEALARRIVLLVLGWQNLDGRIRAKCFHKKEK